MPALNSHLSSRARSSLVLALGALVLLSVAACADDSGGAPAVDRTKPGPTMRSGENCLSCHRAGGQASNKPWTAAGTVFRAADSALDEGVEGATIIIKDKNDKEVRLTSNSVGNFYTPEPLEKPLRMAIEYEGRRQEMPIELDAQGACNGCHSHPDAIGGAMGRIRIP